MRKYLTLSNGIFTVAMVYASIVVAKVYYDRSQLPPDVCPITNNNPFLYSAIVVLLLSVVVTSIFDRKKKDD